MKISFKFFKPGLEGILAQFRHTLDQLDLLIASKLEEAAVHQEAVTKSLEARNAAYEEVVKAKSIKANISALIEEKNG